MGTLNLQARAYASPQVALLAVSSAQRISGLAGWAIKRKNVTTGAEDWLQSQVPFKGQTNPNWQPQDTTVWPIQKGVWKDFAAPTGVPLRYGFCPVYFDPTQTSGVRTDTTNVTWTNEITLLRDLDDEISVAFTNGFLSTQWLARKTPKLADGSYDFKTVMGWLSTPGNSIRQHQAGDVLPLLLEGLKQVRAHGGHMYACLYELTDPELIDAICANADAITVLNAVIPGSDERPPENEAAQAKMRAAGVKVIPYAVASDEIMHDKLLIYIDETGENCWIVSGSTNWTATGLTCQANTTIRISSKLLAKLYLAAFNLMVQDAGMHPTESAWLRARFAIKPPIVTLKSGARVQVFFTPNTEDKTKPKTPHPLPIDRAFGDMLFRSVEECLTALFFMPGTPSYLDAIRWLQENKPDLSVLEVAVSSAQALQKGDVLLQHRPGQPSVAVVASAIEQAFGDFLAEMLKMPDAHAIIHTKAAQGDARHKNRWKVWSMVGSHNGGDKASFQNVEQVLFIFGHRGLNIAMMVNHMDVCDHYRFRDMVNSHTQNDALMGFLSQDDTWQDKYFQGAAQKELEYLTRDDEPEEDGPLPDYLADPEPSEFDTWGTVAADWESKATSSERDGNGGATHSTDGGGSQGHSHAGDGSPRREHPHPSGEQPTGGTPSGTGTQSTERPPQQTEADSTGAAKTQRPPERTEAGVRTPRKRGFSICRLVRRFLRWARG